VQALNGAKSKINDTSAMNSSSSRRGTELSIAALFCHAMKIGFPADDEAE
jgi:hypothetical protein